MYASISPKNEKQTTEQTKHTVHNEEKPTWKSYDILVKRIVWCMTKEEEKHTHAETLAKRFLYYIKA